MVLIKTKKPCLNSHLLLQKLVIHCLNLFLKGPFKIKIMRKKRKEKEISKLIYIPHILRVIFFIFYFYFFFLRILDHICSSSYDNNMVWYKLILKLKKLATYSN